MTSQRDKYFGRLDMISKRAQSEVGERDEGGRKKFLKEKERREKFREVRSKYKTVSKESEEIHEGRNRSFPNLSAWGKHVSDELEIRPKFYQDKGARTGAIAYQLMKKGSAYDLLRGAELYVKIGKEEKALRKLMSALEDSDKVPSDWMMEDSPFYQEVRTFIERNTSDEPSSGLEGKTMVFALSIIGGIALSLSSLSATGNVVANLSGTSRGLGGIVLFIFGLAGLVFNLRK